MPAQRPSERSFCTNAADIIGPGLSAKVAVASAFPAGDGHCLFLNTAWRYRRSARAPRLTPLRKNVNYRGAAGGGRVKQQARKETVVISRLRPSRDAGRYAGGD